MADGADTPDDRLTSWEDLLDDTDWLYDDDEEDAAEPTDADRSALWQRFGLGDAVEPLGNAIRTTMNQPTMDFEYQYQACYPAFADASAYLERESQRIDAAGAEFAPIVEELRAELDRQRGVVAEYFDEHTRRHREYQEAMVPVRDRMARDNQRAFEERMALSRRTDREILAGQDALHRRRVDAFDRWNREWLRNHLR